MTQDRVRYCSNCGQIWIPEIPSQVNAQCCNEPAQVTLPVAEAELLQTFFRARYSPAAIEAATPVAWAVYSKEGNLVTTFVTEMMAATIAGNMKGLCEPLGKLNIRETLEQWRNAAVFWQLQSKDRQQQLQLLEEALHVVDTMLQHGKTLEEVSTYIQQTLHRYNED